MRTYIIADTSPGDEMERSRKGRDYVFNLFKTHGGLSDAEARNTVEISSATFPSLVGRIPSRQREARRTMY